MNRQQRMRQQDTRSEAYRAGYRDHLASTALVDYGRWNTSPSAADREYWGPEYRLYLAGWIAAEKGG